MRKFTFISTLLLAVLSTTVMSQIPNSGFETWSGSDPLGWDNLNSVVIIPSYFTCTKGIPGNPGASYLKLTTKTIPVVGIVPGIALSGKLNKTTFQPTSGFAYNQRPTALTGNWQYMAYGNDQGFIAIAFTKWNSISHIRDTISTTLHPLSGMIMSWESFNIPVTFTDSSIPDTCLIILSSSSLTGPVTDSYLYIDNLDFSFTNAVNETNNYNSSIKIYPNPVNNLLQLEIPYNTNLMSYSYKILNMMGQIIQSSGNIQHNSIETSGLPEGFYQLQITCKEKKYMSKFIKQ